MDLNELERQLLVDPFDLDARRSYARALDEAGNVGPAVKQWSLLLKQEPRDLEAVMSRIRGWVTLEQFDDARSAYLDAKQLEGFEADPELEESLGIRRKANLSLIDGAAPNGRAEVLPLASPEKVRFADVVGMTELKKTVRLKIIEPFKDPGLFARFKKKTGGGVLLYGPPGCGKTMMAKAIATECEASFHSVGISDVLNLWIGESERQLGAVFEEARAEVPSVLFFDELDALAYSRSKARSEHTRTLVNEFLSQLDGLGRDNEKLLVVAATNMPWDVDAAMKRPGRFDRQVFVPPPDAEARLELFQTKLVGVPFTGGDLTPLARATQHYSGADIDGVIESAKEAVLDEILMGGEERPLSVEDLRVSAEAAEPSTLEWLKTARNLVKFGGRDRTYKDVVKYLRSSKLY